MKSLLVVGFVFFLSACVATFPKPKTATCLQTAEAKFEQLNPIFPEDIEKYQQTRNNCWWNKGSGKD